MISLLGYPPETALRQCENLACKGRKEDWLELKKCAACSSALYCSKKCQKEAWPTHKSFCQDVKQNVISLSHLDPEVQRFGYDTCVAFTQALYEYTEAHRWAIHTAINAMIMLKSGPGMTVARQVPPRYILRFRLACKTAPGIPRSQRNPASTFKVVDHGLWTVESCAAGPPQNAQRCAHTLLQCEAQHEQNLTGLGATPAYVGVLPVMFTAEGASQQQTTIFSVFRPPNNVRMDRKARALLGDLVRYCTYTMGTAFPLRAVRREVPYYAVPGRFVRPQGKMWAWEELFQDWDEYFEGRAACDGLSGMEELGLGMRPDASISMYSMFWMMSDNSERRLSEWLGVPTPQLDSAE